MPVEGTNTIAGLQTAQPAGGDPLSDSDNHHRQMKEVLKNIFRGVGGDGFATPILANEDEINFLQGVTSAIQTQLDAVTTLANTKINRDGSEEFSGTVGSSVARAVDSDFCRAQDYAASTLGGTLKARFASGILYLSNTVTNP